jgi:hypothetical protein
MKLNKWKIQENIYLFPSTYSKKDVLHYINASYIRVCEFCGKIDIGLNHFSECKNFN